MLTGVFTSTLLQWVVTVAQQCVSIGTHAHLDQNHTPRRAAVHSFNRMSASQHPNGVNKAGGEVAVVHSWQRNSKLPA